MGKEGPQGRDWRLGLFGFRGFGFRVRGFGFRSLGAYKEVRVFDLGLEVVGVVQTRRALLWLAPMESYLPRGLVVSNILIVLY